MLNLLLAEWTKLRSTASFYWTTGLLLAASALFSVAFTAPADAMAGEGGGNPFAPMLLVMNVGLISSLFVIVQSAMVVTTEYRFGVHTTNFRIAPKRWQVALAKFVLYAILAAAIALIALVIAYSIGSIFHAFTGSWTSNPIARRGLWAVPVGIILLVLFTQGVGWIMRNTAGAVTIVFALQFVVENIIRLIPRVGNSIVEYMPFSNFIAFMVNVPVQGHGITASLAIFAAWALAAWILGVALLLRRDV
ncbi:ABC transporter permease [Corynebacterium liangguodongii]|uniref:ABC transporter permease n=1 Tax=Corynebacterium liangguodongii TaxID=2079535 RepID=UPI001304BBA1|nr:ABC transporter permease [Corynebacterium liangguodongii]